MISFILVKKMIYRVVSSLLTVLKDALTVLLPYVKLTIINFVGFRENRTQAWMQATINNWWIVCDH